MPAPFYPVFRHADLATIAAAFWPRTVDEVRFPVTAKLYRTDPGTQVLVHSQKPVEAARGEVVLVHGLEGSSHSGYMVSMAGALLDAGYEAHRFNLRTCGGTEFLCRTLYHGGFTADLLFFLLELDRQRRTPVHLVGFSLGGNLSLKLAGELGADASRLLRSVCSISTPIDLGACARRIDARRNRGYQWWFLRSMKRRMQVRRQILDGMVSLDGLAATTSIYDFDDRFTGPSFGFDGADHYYKTQSAVNFLEAIRVPTLLVQAKDDPLIPFACFEKATIAVNPHLHFLATEHGGHLGYVSRPLPRFWVDGVAARWIAGGGAL